MYLLSATFRYSPKPPPTHPLLYALQVVLLVTRCSVFTLVTWPISFLLRPHAPLFEFSFSSTPPSPPAPEKKTDQVWSSCLIRQKTCFVSKNVLRACLSNSSCVASSRLPTTYFFCCQSTSHEPCKRTEGEPQPCQRHEGVVKHLAEKGEVGASLFGSPTWNVHPK